MADSYIVYRKRGRSIRYCAARNCYNCDGRCPGRSFFRFPSDEERCAVWAKNSGREDLLGKSAKHLYNNCVLCQDHFEDKCFYNATEKVRLLKNAVPTIFDSNPTPPSLVKIKGTDRFIEQSLNKKNCARSPDKSGSTSGSDTSDGDPESEQVRRHRKKLQFRNPGKFMEDFDPERSGREMRKVNRKIYKDKVKKNQVYDNRGLLLADSRDVCDCLMDKCPGCHYPCPKCNSRKCGGDCRCNRRWYYSEVEVEGTRFKLTTTLPSTS